MNKIVAPVSLAQLLKNKKVKDMTPIDIVNFVDKAQDMVANGNLDQVKMANGYLDFMKNALDIIFIAQEISEDEPGDED